ncbi:50S ribosomal protein L13 [sediment metagenome]|uniref:50S ribosomal protein L13 n=1 Tax=sediment metagenome TaxID=749907 RepID=D9PK60_9ZZZZ
MREYNFDAKGKKLGRLATELSVVLMGKDEADFAPNKVADVKVIVNNASQLDINDKKMDSKIYDTYSGYPSGRKEFTMRKLIADKGFEAVIKNAVNGMLPKNKLRDKVMKNLIVND